MTVLYERGHIEVLLKEIEELRPEGYLPTEDGVLWVSRVFYPKNQKKSQYVVLRHILKYMVTNPTECLREGICIFFRKLVHETSDELLIRHGKVMRASCDGWDNFGGGYNYPINDKDSPLAPSEQFEKLALNVDVQKDLRVELLTRMISTCEAQLKCIGGDPC